MNSTSPALDDAIAAGMRGESIDLTDVLLSGHLVVPSSTEPTDTMLDLTPVLYDRAGTPMLAAFTTFDLPEQVAALAEYRLTISGRDLIDRMPPDAGIVINPGLPAGLELLPQQVGQLRRVGRDA
ncbi:SseB family protein [Cellulomonas sp. NPDC089187]|uniref:SseB family protein n=1 Tax=Cellulomonas sp. NPDC089187 TaxID=3154970 RepID=UPI00341FE238